MTASRTLDARGLQCPLPVLKARKMLLSMAPGETLEVLATDPLAAIDLPNFCREAGHRFIGKAEHGSDAWAFLIERGQ